MKVLLIGWDAADWKVINPLMDAGQMPNLQRLVERGSIGPLATIHPILSPMLWTSIATGKRPFKHGIHGFSEPTPDGRGVQPVSNLSRTCKAVWNILNQNDLRSIVVGWWPSHPAEPLNGVMVSDHFHKAFGPLEKGWPVMPASVHPPELAATLAEFRLHPNEVAGEMMEAFVPRAREVDQDKDTRLAALTKIFCECASIHGTATWLMENRPWDFFAVYYDAIDHFCHGFMRYHPPRQEHIPEADYEMYKGVVSAAYRFHDEMLGTLLAKAGPDTRVVIVSDHGFHPDHLRPKGIPHIPAGPAIEHRDFGVVAIAGPGVRKDELLHGASILDVTPTVLAMYGLPTGDDMDGRVLAGAFEEPLQAKPIPSWENEPGDDGRHPPHTRLDPEAAHEALQQLVALGYIEKPDDDRDQAVANTIAELRYNLGEAYQDAGRHAEALPILRELYRADPNEQRFAVHLFVSCQALGRVEEMRQIVEDLDGRRRRVFEEAEQSAKEWNDLLRKRAEERQAAAKPESANPELLLNEQERKETQRLEKLLNFQPAVVNYLKAQVFAAQRRWRDALDSLQLVQDAHMVRPGLLLQVAELYRRLQEWGEAEKMWARALEIDPDNAQAHLGMCRVALHDRDYDAAAELALDGLQRQYHLPVGHFLLGVSLVGRGDYARAREAFQTALALNPNFRQAHLRLGVLLKRRLNDPKGAAEHFHMFHELRAARPVPLQQQTAQMPPVRAAERRSSGEVMPPLGDDEVIIVSGLPRSGTSMLMQMLAAGGMPVLTDSVRQPDEDNPRGYFEYEPVKRLGSSSDWLTEARGKAVKVVAPLLRSLPRDLACRVVFVERNFDEILLSQRQMLARDGASADASHARDSRLKEEYERLVLRVKKYLDQRPNTRVLHIHRDDVLSNPQSAAEAVNAFLGGKYNPAAMASIVDPKLNRQKSRA